MSDAHHQFMQEAIALAAANVRSGGGGPFGAVIVRNGEVVGRGANAVTRLNDPTAHAEVMAIRDACSRLQDFQLTECEIYSSCEPCPMCLSAIYWARLQRLWFASTKDEAAEAGFRDAFLYEQIPLPLEARSLPTARLVAAGHEEPFALWKSQVDKVDY
jgi:guanine deaminase